VRRAGRRRHLPAADVVRRAEPCLAEVEMRLRAVYGKVQPGHAPLGNKRNPVDELIFIQLSVRTREGTYNATYRALRRLLRGRWERLLSVPDSDALQAIGTGGMAGVKLARLRAQLLAIRERFGRLSLSPLRHLATEDADAFLQSLPGVGPKVSRCVLLYSLDRDVFPVDSNCHRVLNRLGLVPHAMHVKAAHDYLQELVPSGLRRSLHVNLVHHGRETCISGRPRCERCVLLSLCPTGQRLNKG
jgi:endonuclease III